MIGKGVLELVKMDPGGDWTAVLKLKPGDELVSAFGVPLVVDSINVDDAATRVYSLEVEGLHSFAVGELAAWVHNARIRKFPTGKPGPSGEPRRHFIMCGCRKEAYERALDAGQGTPIEHRRPRKGCPHFHPATRDGDKIPGPHFEYPK